MPDHPRPAPAQEGSPLGPLRHWAFAVLWTAKRCVRRERLSVDPTRASGYRSRIHQRGRRNHPLSSAQQRANHAKSRIRARIEQVFGAQQRAPGGRVVRTIGMMRARAKIGLQNLAYSIRRLVTLERLAAA